MVGLIITAHGGIAAEILRSATSIMGPLPQVQALTIERGADVEDIYTQLKHAIAEVNSDGDGVLIMTDMFGGTPANISNRFLNKLIDHDRLFNLWPVVDTFEKMNWQQMFKVAAPTCIWFWTPVNTYTFLLPSEFRVLSGALLAIALGFILGMAKKLGLQDS